MRTKTNQLNYATCKVHVELPCSVVLLELDWKLKLKNLDLGAPSGPSHHHIICGEGVSCASEVPTRLTSAPLNTMGAPVRWCNSAATVARFARAKGTWDTKQYLSIYIYSRHVSWVLYSCVWYVNPYPKDLQRFGVFLLSYLLAHV